MKLIAPITATVMVLLLSGCAASLVYDRDRPATRCKDSGQRCQQSGLRAPDVAPQLGALRG